jgi:O-glycosyl hydrolase
MDPVGERLLQTLKVTGARIGVPLNHWAPDPGVYSQEKQALASLQAIQLLKARRIPLIVSVWEPPRWMLPGAPEEQGQQLHPDKWADCIEAIGEYLRAAKEYFGTTPDYYSFNEPDYGVNVKMSPQDQARFIRDAAKAWAAKGIKIKFLIGDTANGTNLAPYVEHLMAQKDLLPHLGPIAYHTWDALGAPDDVYEGIARLGRLHKKAIWATEAGHDAQLWQKPNAWGSWENALGLVRAYSRSYRLSGAERLDYWTYQDNYTLLDPKTLAPHAAFYAIKDMEATFAPGRQLVWSKSDGQGVEHAVTLGENGRQMFVLLSNDAGAVPVQLSGLLPSRTYRVTVSGPKQRAVASRLRSDSQGRLTVPLPTRSYAVLMSQ